jgi:hypothetical protein
MKSILKAACLGAVPAVIVFARIFFADEIEDFVLAQQGMFVTHCFGEPPESLAFRAGAWAFAAYVVVFTPALLYFSAKIRRDVFHRDQNDHAA